MKASRRSDSTIMQILRRRAYARAGLVGNPSDGYHGKTISIIVKNYYAEVVLYEWDDVELLLGEESRSRFGSIHDLVRDVKLHGYYGGIRLVKAAVKKFAEYCYRQKIELHDRNFSVRFESTIPRQVGLAGSSAIIVATLRALMEFYGVEIPLEVQPSAFSIGRRGRGTRHHGRLAGPRDPGVRRPGVHGFRRRADA